MNSKDIETPKLDYLTLKVTNRCNLNCFMCGQVYSGLRNQKEDLNFHVVKERLNECKNIKTVYLFGGEPLLYKEIIPLLKLLHDKSIDTLISTNGTLLDHFVDDLIKYKVRDVSISIDSFQQEVCDGIRGTGVYSKVISNIEKMLDAKKKSNSHYPYIGINCVILKCNYDKLVDFYDWFESNYPEIDRINFESPMAVTEELGLCYEQVMKTEFNCEAVSWRWFYNKVDFYNDEELQIVHNQIETLKNKRKATFQAPTCYNDIINAFTNAYAIPGRICIYPYSMLAILPNGDVTFCVDFPDYTVGNIYHNSLQEIFYNERSNHLREYLKMHMGLPICARCPHRFDKDEFLIQPQTC